MMSFAVEYKVAINKFTADRDNDVRDLELNKDEWDLVEQLCKILMVRHSGYVIHGIFVS